MIDTKTKIQLIDGLFTYYFISNWVMNNLKYNYYLYSLVRGD